MIDPVHMQNIVTRAPEVARVQRVQEGAPEAQAQVFAQELARETQKAEETVPSPPRSMKTEWRREKKKREDWNEGAPEKEGGNPENRDRELPKDLGRFIDTTA